MPRAFRVVTTVAMLAVFAVSAHAQRATYPIEEFGARRQKLCQALGSGTLLLFGATMAQPAARFRQDNDFFYLTGVEDPNAALVVDLERCRAFLFLPELNESQIRIHGEGSSSTQEEAKRRGFAAIHPVPYLEELLARWRRSGVEPLWVRLSDRDLVDSSRGDTTLYLARRQAFSFGGQPSEDAWRSSLLRARYPYYELKDVVPAIDALRMIKTPREIEILRRNGKVSAEGICRAIAATRVGGYEYELEAEATYGFLRGGAEGPAYPAIVGSGPNSIIWHYDRSERQLGAGELVVMDYGASMAYLTMDITRTWPASGHFDELQLRAYRCVLEAEKAIIAALKPGVTRAQTREIGREIYKKWGFEGQRPPSAGHFVGLAVHDVGESNVPFAAGMVVAVEPIIEIKDKNLHIRIEDTVLITADGPEILTSAVPKEVDELLALVGKSAR
jgi:Xaa-Pro aminopeptidase